MKCRTKDCDRELYYDEELTMGYCDNCLDILADQYQERQEFLYYHTEKE